MTPTQQSGFRRLATFWLDNLPPINLWSLQQFQTNILPAPYKLTPSENQNPPKEPQTK